MKNIVLEFDENKIMNTRPIVGVIRQGEQNIESVTITGPTSYGIVADITTLTWVVAGIYRNHDFTAQQVVAGIVSGDSISFSWIPDEQFSAYGGDTFELELIGENADGTQVLKIVGSQEVPVRKCERKFGQLVRSSLEEMANAVLIGIQNLGSSVSDAAASALKAANSATSATTAAEDAAASAGEAATSAAAAGSAVADETTRAKAAEQANATAITGKAPTSHASSATTYGLGTGSYYGHVKLSDATDSGSSTSSGVAATPAAVKAVDTKIETINGNIKSVSCLLSVSAWAEASAPYTQSVTVSGMTADWIPGIPIAPPFDGMDNQGLLNLMQMLGCISKIESSENKLTFTCASTHPRWDVKITVPGVM